MKKALMILAVLMFVCITKDCFAKVVEVQLRDLTNNAVISTTYVKASELLRTAPVTINELDFPAVDGSALLYMTISTSGVMNVQYKYSMDGTNFFIPSNTSMVPVSTTINSLSNTSVVYVKPYPAKFIRFDVTGATAGRVTDAKFIYTNKDK